MKRLVCLLIVAFGVNARAQTAAPPPPIAAPMPVAPTPAPPPAPTPPTEAPSTDDGTLHPTKADRATCLLLDIHLGGISGIELQRRLAAAGSKCPVIFMTAVDDETTRKEAMTTGCIAYLRKPFEPQLLLDAIGKAAA